MAAASPEPLVKKSKAGICHERGTHGYKQTKRFDRFGSLEACLKSGGRLPKNSASKKQLFDPNKPARPGDEGVLFGPLVKVIDGDSLVVKIQGADLHFRLSGIDAPESDQPFGDDAGTQLAALISNQQCVLVYDEGDLYGRIVAHLWIGDVYVEAEMVKRGMAWFDSASADGSLLYALEEEARTEKRGLWASPSEERVAPWDWRKEER